MGFKSQEPVFVQRARAIADAIMRRLINAGAADEGLHPMSVQATDVHKQEFVGITLPTTIVTFRYYGHYHVRIVLGYCDKDLSFQTLHELWRVIEVMLTLPHKDESHGSSSENLHKYRPRILYRGVELYNLLVTYCGLDTEDLVYTHLAAEHRIHGSSGLYRCSYTMPNGEVVTELCLALASMGMVKSTMVPSGHVMKDDAIPTTIVGDNDQT